MLSFVLCKTCKLDSSLNNHSQFKFSLFISVSLSVCLFVYPFTLTCDQVPQKSLLILYKLICQNDELNLQVFKSAEHVSFGLVGSVPQQVYTVVGDSGFPAGVMTPKVS